MPGAARRRLRGLGRLPPGDIPGSRALRADRRGRDPPLPARPRRPAGGPGTCASTRRRSGAPGVWLAASADSTSSTSATRPTCCSWSALPLKLRGARVIFDQHDLVPELYVSRFGRGKDLLYRGVVALERLTYRAGRRRHRHQRQLPARRPRTRPQGTGARIRRPKRPRSEPLCGRRPRSRAQAGQAAPAVLPGRHGTAGRGRLRAPVARRAARHSAATTGTPRSWARATASTRCARSQAGWGWMTTLRSPGASRMPSCSPISRPQTSRCRRIPTIRSTTSRR